MWEETVQVSAFLLVQRGETEAQPHLETFLLAANQWQCPVTTALSLPLTVSRLERSRCKDNTHRLTPALGQGHQLGGGGCCGAPGQRGLEHQERWGLFLSLGPLVTGRTSESLKVLLATPFPASFEE